MLTPAQRRHQKLKEIAMARPPLSLTPTDVHLRADNAAQFAEELHHQRTAGLQPQVYLEDITGTNPHYIKKVIRENSDRVYISSRAHQQMLSWQRDPGQIRPNPRMAALIAVLLVVISILLGSQLLANLVN